MSRCEEFPPVCSELWTQENRLMITTCTRPEGVGTSKDVTAISAVTNALMWLRMMETNVRKIPRQRFIICARSLTKLGLVLATGNIATGNIGTDPCCSAASHSETKIWHETCRTETAGVANPHLRWSRGESGQLVRERARDHLCIESGFSDRNQS